MFTRLEEEFPYDGWAENSPKVVPQSVLLSQGDCCLQSRSLSIPLQKT